MGRENGWIIVCVLDGNHDVGESRQWCFVAIVIVDLNLEPVFAMRLVVERPDVGDGPGDRVYLEYVLVIIVVIG